MTRRSPQPQATTLTLRAGEQQDAATAKAALLELVRALAYQYVWADYEAEQQKK